MLDQIEKSRIDIENLVTQVKGELDRVSGYGFDEIREHISTYNRVVEFAAYRTAIADPALIHPGHLNDIYNRLATINSRLRSLGGDIPQDQMRDELEVGASDTQALSAEVNRMPIVDVDATPGQSLESLARRARGFEGLIAAQSQRYEQSVQDMKGKIDRVAADIQANTGRLDQAIAQFNDQETARSNEFRHRLEQKVEGVITKSESQIDEVTGRLSAITSRAEEIGAIGSAANQAENYISDAEREHRRAIFYQKVMWIAVLLGTLVTTILFTLPTNGSTLSADPTALEVTAFLIGRLSLSWLGIAAAIYFSRQSSHHRSREERSRRLANELLTFRPFLSEIPETTEDAADTNSELTKRQIIGDAAARYFAGNEHDRMNSKNEGKNTLSQEQLKPVIELVKELGKLTR